MKKLLFILSLSFSSVLFAQERNGITYQALIVDPSGEFLPGADNNYSPLKNTSVCLQFHIIDSTNSYEYSEQHTVTTDNFGMVNLVIGTGSAIGGVGWENVSWSASAKSLKVDVDKTGSCSSFEELSNQPLTSVPFALYSPGSDTPGPQGDPGEEGMSAYEVWLDLGNTGTEQDFIDSLKGPEGDPGDPGTDGDSAYDVWIEAGNTGTEQEFLDSLKATDGNDGDSAYDIWIAAGNTGTEQEFLDSLKATDGNDGDSAYDIWIAAGNTGTEQEFLDSLKATDGNDGDSAYDIWIAAGNTGSEQDFIDSLVGPQGEPGTSGASTGGVSEFGCYNIQNVFQTDSNSQFNEIDSEPGYDLISHLQDDLYSKHIRVNFSFRMIDTDTRTLKLTALDQDDNEIICFYDVTVNKVFNDVSDFSTGEAYSYDFSRNGLYFIEEVRHYRSDYWDKSSFLVSIDVYSHSSEISKILFETQSTIGAGNTANFNKFQIFEFKCDNPTFSNNYIVQETTIDFNGQNWTLVQLGTQQWTKNNLDVASYTDGTTIPQFTGTNAEWAALTTGAWRYFNDDSNFAYLGKIYNSYAVNGIHDNDSNTPNKVLAPDGYRIPTQEDIKQLLSFLITNGFNSNGSFTGKLGYNQNHLAKSLATSDDLWNPGSGTSEFKVNVNLLKNNTSKLDFKPYYYQSGWREGFGARYWLFNNEGKKINYGIDYNEIGLRLLDVTNSNDEQGCFIRLIKE